MIKVTDITCQILSVENFSTEHSKISVDQRTDAVQLATFIYFTQMRWLFMIK